jgi:prepilin-type N-terminal cleavage/methylation domain-containing protein
VNRYRGFTLIELLTVLFVLGILASIALLKYADLRNNAVAAQVVQEIRAVQVAALNYYAEREAWPPEAGAGAVPTGLGPLLPGPLATSFDRGDYMLDYENFGATGTDVVIGVAVTTANPKLFAKLARYLGGGSPFFVAGSRITYLIAGPGGAF